jgi:hypothetical protein
VKRLDYIPGGALEALDSPALPPPQITSHRHSDYPAVTPKPFRRTVPADTADKPKLSGFLLGSSVRITQRQRLERHQQPLEGVARDGASRGSLHLERMLPGPVDATGSLFDIKRDGQTPNHVHVKRVDVTLPT